MSLAWIRERLEQFRGREAIVEGATTVGYTELIAAVDALRQRFAAWGVRAGDALGFTGDHSTASVTRFVAALLDDLVAVPIPQATGAELERALAAAPMDWYCPPGAPLDAPPERRSPPEARTSHALLETLRAREHAGIIIMTSGSTGPPKVILQDAARLLDRFRHARNPYRSLVLLLPDHIGGVNNLFSMLTCGATLILPAERTPEAICALVARTRATLLPVTPTFLGLMLASGAHEHHDMSSLKVICYSTEIMPEHTLRAANAAFPDARLVQLYGSSELGVFRSRSYADDSTLIRLESEGVDWRIVDDRLQVRGMDSMVGYLSGEPAGFDADGWYDTGDVVAVEDGYLRILGRQSEIINVGGQKVYPGEVESALNALDGVADSSAYGAAHALTGQVVHAHVSLSTDEDARGFKRRMRKALRGQLAAYKIPVKVTVGDVLVSHRYKKLRPTGGAEEDR